MASEKSSGPDPAQLVRAAEEALADAEDYPVKGRIERASLAVAKATPNIERDSAERLRARRDALKTPEQPERPTASPDPLAALREAESWFLIDGDDTLIGSGPEIGEGSEVEVISLRDALKATEPLIAENEELRRERDEAEQAVGGLRRAYSEFCETGNAQQLAKTFDATSHLAHRRAIQTARDLRAAEAREDALREGIEQAEAVIHETLTLLLVLAPMLEQPYEDDARWSPWARWVDRTEATPWKRLQAVQQILRALSTQDEPNA